MIAPPGDRDWLSTSELGELLGVTPSCVRYWVAAGLVRPDTRTAGGHARFRRSTAETIAQGMRRRWGLSERPGPKRRAA